MRDFNEPLEGQVVYINPPIKSRLGNRTQTDNLEESALCHLANVQEIKCLIFYWFIDR